MNMTAAPKFTPSENTEEWYARCKAENAASKLEAARMFVLAFDADSLPTWIAATQLWNDRKGNDALWHAVENMRSLWYHDGSVAAKTRLHIARDCVARAALAKVNANA